MTFATSFLVFNIGTARANPTAFPPGGATATATTSPNYMTAGTATTTLTCDSYSTTCLTSGATGRPYAFDSATLLIQLTASSTLTVLNTNFEYSQDGIDWYQDGGILSPSFATSTKPFDLSQVNQLKLTYASSTAGLGAVPSSQATTTRAVLVRTPTRFIRAIFTLPAGSTAGAVWATWIPQRQQI